MLRNLSGTDIKMDVIGCLICYITSTQNSWCYVGIDSNPANHAFFGQVMTNFKENVSFAGSGNPIPELPNARLDALSTKLTRSVNNAGVW